MTRSQRLRRVLFTRESLLLLVLVALFILFSVGVKHFFNLANLFEQSRYWVAPGLMAVAMTFIIATGGIDLSVGSILALSGMVMGLLYRDAGWPMWLAACAAPAAGLAAGAFNGGVISYLHVPPLVVTLATMTLFRGLVMGLSQADAVSDFPKAFLWLGQGGFSVAGTAEAPVLFPISLIVLMALFAAGWLAMRRSWVGRFTELIGENETAARFAAIDVRLLKFGLYAFCGLICGLASLFYTAHSSTALPTPPTGMELKVIACVVIGGTRISGGQGSVLGSLLGLLIIGILEFGLEMAEIPSEEIIIVVGFVLIVTAVFNEWIARRKTGGLS